MLSIATTTFGRLARTHAHRLHVRRACWAVGLSTLLSACGTLSGPDLASLGQMPDPEHVQEAQDASVAAPAPMPEAIALPEAAMPQPPSTESARRLGRRGQPLPAPGIGRDGPGTRRPEDLLAVPDAVPRHEPLHPSANRPYTLAGRAFMPQTARVPLVQSGSASWYGSYFHGRRTATGEVYDMHAMSAAHPTMALPSYARVTNTSTGQSVVVRVNDRGPFVGERIIDLSYAAAVRLGFAAQGVAAVKVESIRTTPGIDDTMAANATLAQAAASAAASAQTARPATRTPPQRTPAATAANEPSISAAAAVPRKPQAANKVYVKIGAFRQRLNATRIGERIAKALPAVQKAISITPRDDGILLVQAGPYADRSEAIVVADALRRELQIEPQIVVQ